MARRGIGKEVDNFVKTFMQMWKMVQRDREIELREARRNAPKEMSASERARFEEEQAIKKAEDEGERSAPALKGTGSKRGEAYSSLGADTGAPRSLINNESGGRWNAENDATGAGGAKGHFGRVQFGVARLNEAKAAGVIPENATPQDFMRSPDMQRAAEKWHFADIRNFIKSNGYDRMVGQKIGGTPVTEDGMLAVAHLGGKGGLQKFIESGGKYNPADRNGTRLTDYFSRHGGASKTAGPDKTGTPTAQAIPTEKQPYQTASLEDEDLGARWNAEDAAEGGLDWGDTGEGYSDELSFAEGGAVPATGWRSKAPDQRGSVFLEYQRARPAPAPAAAPTAIPAGPGTRVKGGAGDRFRALKAERANRPTTSSGYQFDGNSNQLWTAIAANRDASGIPKYPGEGDWQARTPITYNFKAGASGKNATDAERAEYYGGLRMDPSGKYAIRPPAIDASAEERAAYLALPKATGEQDVLRGVNWRKAIDDDYYVRAEEAARNKSYFGNMGTWGDAPDVRRGFDESTGSYAEGGLVEEEQSPEPTAGPAPTERMPQETPAPREAIPVSAPAQAAPAQDMSNSNSGGSGAAWRSGMEGYDPTIFVNPDGVQDAVKAGMGWIQKTFGFDQQRAALPGTDPRRQQALQAFAAGEGAPTQAEIKTIDKTLDPEGKLTPEVKSLARMYGVYKLYESRGDMQGAARMAGAMMLHSRRVLSAGGAAIEQMIKRGNTAGAFKVAEQAYNEAVPDGQKLKVTPDKGGTFKVELFDQDGQLTQQGRYGVNELLKMATGMQNGTLWFQKFGEMASGGGRTRAPSVAGTAPKPERPRNLTAEERSDMRDAERAAGAVKGTKEQADAKRAEVDQTVPTIAVPRGGPADAADRRADQTRESVKGAENREQAFNVLDAKYREQSKRLNKDSVARRAASSDEDVVLGLGTSSIGKNVEKMPASVKGTLTSVARTALGANDISENEAGRVVGDMFAKGIDMLGDGTVRPAGSKERGVYLDGRSVRAIMDARGDKTTSVKNTPSLADAIMESRRMAEGYAATDPKPKAAGPEAKAEADRRMNNRRADKPAEGGAEAGPEKRSPYRRLMDHMETATPPQQPPPMTPQQRFDNTQEYIRRRRSAIPVP